MRYDQTPVISMGYREKCNSQTTKEKQNKWKSGRRYNVDLHKKYTLNKLLCLPEIVPGQLLH